MRDHALLSVEHLVVEYPVPGGTPVRAVSDVSLDVLDGETVGLVGESGCGKSTTARAVMRHVPVTSGTIRFDGHDLTAARGEALRRARTQLQMIFQDPVSSLNPRRPVEDIIGEGLRIWGRGSSDEQRTKVRELMESVGLTYDPAARRRRGQFSGGQAQRVSIARALILEPKLIVCDEPVSALDVSVQAQILNLLADMRQRYQLTLLFISHDLSVVKHISDRIVVMYRGKICEVASPRDVYARPRHPYTASLIAAIPIPRPERRVAERLPEATDAASDDIPEVGCRFRHRCPNAQAICAEREPTIRALGADHYVACHYPLTDGTSGNPGSVGP